MSTPSFIDGEFAYVLDSQSADFSGEIVGFEAEVVSLGNDRFLVTFIRNEDYVSASGWIPQDTGMRIFQVNSDLTITAEPLTAFDSVPLYLTSDRRPMDLVSTNKVLILGEQAVDAYTAPSGPNDDKLTAFFLDCSGSLPTISGSLELDPTGTLDTVWTLHSNSQIAMLSPTRALVTSVGTRNISHNTGWIHLLDVSGVNPVLLAGPTPVYVDPNFQDFSVLPISPTTAIMFWRDWVSVNGWQRYSFRFQWIDITGDTIQTENNGYGPGPIVSRVGNPIVHVDNLPAEESPGWARSGVALAPGNKIIISSPYYDGVNPAQYKYLQISYNPSDHSSFVIDGIEDKPPDDPGHELTSYSVGDMYGVATGVVTSLTDYEDLIYQERTGVFTIGTSPPVDKSGVTLVSGSIDPLPNFDNSYYLMHGMRYAYNPSTGRGLMAQADNYYVDSTGYDYYSVYARSFQTDPETPSGGGGGTGWGSDGSDGNWSIGQIGWH